MSEPVLPEPATSEAAVPEPVLPEPSLSEAAMSRAGRSEPAPRPSCCARSVPAEPDGLRAGARAGIARAGPRAWSRRPLGPGRRAPSDERALPGQADAGRPRRRPAPASSASHTEYGAPRRGAHTGPPPRAGPGHGGRAVTLWPVPRWHSVHPNGDEVGHTYAAEDGSFHLDDIAAGTYTLVVAALHYRPAARVIVLSHGETLAMVSLLGVGSLVVRVARARDAMPVAAGIELFNADGGLAAQCQAGDDGVSILPDLLEGNYELVVERRALLAGPRSRGGPAGPDGHGRGPARRAGAPLRGGARPRRRMVARHLGDPGRRVRDHCRA